MLDCLKYDKSINKALIIHPGALGDCVITLRLANFLNEVLAVDMISFIGQGDYISFMPGRTNVSRIRNIHSVNLEKLFVNQKDFDLPENDPLISIFGQYNWIISFLGDKGSDFEANLAYTACITSSPELVMLPSRAPDDCNTHISDFQIGQILSEKMPSLEALSVTKPESYLQKPPQELIVANLNDIKTGIDIIHSKSDIAIKPSTRIAVLSPGSGGIDKCWHIDNYLHLAEILKTKGIEPVFLIGNVELERFEKQQLKNLQITAPLISSITIQEVIGLLSVSDIFIGNDSGVGHISAAMGMPTISIFGATNPQIYKPFGKQVQVFELTTDQFKKCSKSTVERIAENALEIICAINR